MSQSSQFRNYSGTDMQIENSMSKNHLAVISLVLGIASLLIAGPFTGIPGLVVGIRARCAAVRGEASNRGLALIGIVVSLIGTIGSIALIAWLAVHGLPASLA